ncbi:MAG: Ig-like domain-containing protein [Anaerovoracaceae bacterium]
MKKKLSIIMAICLCVCTILFVPVTDNTAYAASISLNKTVATVVNGKTVQLKVKGTSAKVKWSTSSKSIATVTTKGLVKAKKPGKVTITAKVANKTLKCRITVKKNTNDYYKTLKSNIIKYGEQDESGNYFIKDYDNYNSPYYGEAIEACVVKYNPEYNYFEFIYHEVYADYDYLSTYVSMIVEEPFEKYVNIHIEDFYFLDDYSKACYMADDTINASNYYDEKRLYPFITNNVNSSSYSSQELASTEFNLAMMSWDIMLDDFCNIEMKNLGFPNFTF